MNIIDHMQENESVTADKVQQQMHRIYTVSHLGIL